MLMKFDRTTLNRMMKEAASRVIPQKWIGMKSGKVYEAQQMGSHGLIVKMAPDRQ